ncbi:MAG: Mpv17/PMP22 family protein [Bacteroidales bacterium]|nr:Mpv17/PMP22 family protein [Bacteroidales bacterium]
MKRSDLFLALLLAVLFVPFFISTTLYDYYIEAVNHYPLASSFVKFSILATIGESIGLRIRTGKYNKKGFGLLPRAIVWGFLGITIKLAFDIFGAGSPVFIEKSLGIEGVSNALAAKEMTLLKILGAFSISLFMNVIYAPVMMTIHKISDTHIVNHGGTVKGLFTRIHFGNILSTLNWDVMWHFVFKKTIPFFWIPAHTITFLLPAEFRVLFAAILGIALGIILAFASLMKTASR